MQQKVCTGNAVVKPGKLYAVKCQVYQQFLSNQNKEDIILHPENYTINHIYHYEGNSNPDDEATVYGIVSKYGLKGVFVTGTSANSSDKNAEAIAKLSIKGKHSTTL